MLWTKTSSAAVVGVSTRAKFLARSFHLSPFWGTQQHAPAQAQNSKLNTQNSHLQTQNSQTTCLYSPPSSYEPDIERYAPIQHFCMQHWIYVVAPVSVFVRWYIPRQLHRSRTPSPKPTHSWPRPLLWFPLGRLSDCRCFVVQNSTTASVSLTQNCLLLLLLLLTNERTAATS